MNINIQYEHYGTNRYQKKGQAVAVQIPLNQYKKLLELAEEVEDIKAYDRAVKRKHVFSPFNEAIKELKVKRKK